jgi:hypothetical protein
MTILKVDESILTPVSTPGVSDDPVASLGSRVTGELDGVVNAGSTLVGCQDSSVVVLPLRGIAADGQGHLGQSLVDGSFVSSNGGDSGDLQVGVRVAVAGIAGTVLSSVGVAVFSVLASLVNDPLESFLRITSTTSIIVAVAVYDFLRRSFGH